MAQSHRRFDALIAALVVLLVLVVGGMSLVFSEVGRVRQEGEAIRSLAEQAKAEHERALRENPL